MKTTDFLNSLIGKTFNCDFYNGNCINKDGMVIKRCMITEIKNFEGDEFDFYYTEECGFEMEDLQKIEEKYDFIKKTENGYKIYFNDDVFFFDNEGNEIKKMDAFFE